MSLRLRLTLWYALVLCLGLAAFAGAVLWQTQQAANAALDQTLSQRARDVDADLLIGPSIILRRDAPDESGRQPGEATLWIRVLTPHGVVVVRQGPALPGLPRQVLADARAGFHEWEPPGGRHLRIFIRPVLRHGRRAATIQIITATDQLQAARRQLLTAMGVAGVLIVLVAALGGLFLANNALRPVDRITRLAAQIGAGDLHRRVSDEARESGRRNDELGRLARTFDAMLGRLEEADERRRRLTADAAHELSTPIATISSGAEIALRHPRGADDYRAALRHILDESQHMGRVVDDLLLLARADAGRLPLRHELVEFDDLCRQSVEALGPLALENGIALSVVLPAQATLVLGDEMRLGQVVRNLLDNALRYTPAGGAVTLTLCGEPYDSLVGRAVVLRVADSGPGIAPAERERIFERFHRANGTAAMGEQRRAGGSGLGLAICKAIVEAHGGHIRVEDVAAVEPGARSGGACFLVALPAVTAASMPE